jgi:preprotein translocase subunit SecG
LQQFSCIDSTGAEFKGRRAWQPTFSASNQVMGVRKTADFLEKATWTLAATWFFQYYGIGYIPRDGAEVERVVLIEGQIEQTIDPSALPSFPTTVPDLPEEDDQSPENDEGQ